MFTKREHYNTIVSKLTDQYGSIGGEDVLINITGDYRNDAFLNAKQDYIFACLKMTLVICMAFAMFNDMCMAIAAIAAMGLGVFVDYYRGTPNVMFDGEFMKINGVNVGVVVPSQKEEGELEERNFVETRDAEKLLAAMEKANLPNCDEKTVWSVGSTSAQLISGQKYSTTTAIELGIDNVTDEKLIALLNSFKRKKGIIFVMNSAGYGVDGEAGILSNDNARKEDKISLRIVPRTIGGTGNNEGAMKFVRRLVELHKQGDYAFILAIIPRGDKTMPQGGSHSKQQIVDHIRRTNGRAVRVIEVSGKQTKEFTIKDDYELNNYSTGKLCEMIKERKLTATNGKTYGSVVVFA
jgi:hypothetical protein